MHCQQNANDDLNGSIDAQQIHKGISYRLVSCKLPMHVIKPRNPIIRCRDLKTFASML